MGIRAWVAIALGSWGLTLPSLAEACGGGGVVTSQRQGSIGADSQRVILAVHDDGVTEVVTQIVVPETTDDYGALLPLPSEPTLDSTPVSEAELTALDRSTAPTIVTTTYSGSGDGGCGCPFIAGSASEAGGGGDRSGDANVSEPVDIGPVTAVVLSGTSDAVNAWLADNGFAISAGDQAIVEEYSGYYFVAVRRNENAAPGGPTSIGIHFTMPGDHRELPFRFARIGAGSMVRFTVFVATPEAVAPSPPFEALTLDDLDANLLRLGDYAGAVRAAVKAHDDRAFVLESVTRTVDLLPTVGSLRRLVDVGTLTRMSTILPLGSLTEDADFNTPHEGYVPSSRHVQATRPLESRHASMGLLAALLFAGIWRRRSQ